MWRSLVVLLLFVGCGYQVAPPVVPVNAQYIKAGRHNFKFSSAWWQGFHDTQLSELVEQLFIANNDLKAAMMRRESLRHQLSVAQSGWWPDSNVSGSLEHSKISAIRAPGVPDRNIKVYEAGGAASWEIDLWGAVRSSVEVQRQSLKLSEFELSALRASLVGDLIRAYVSVCAGEQRVELLERSVESARAGFRVLSEQHHSGLVDDLTFHQAEVNLQLLEAALPSERAARDASIINISVLLGQAPNLSEFAGCNSGIPLYRESVGLDRPAELLQRRPDLLAAEARLRAAVANVGVQVAELFPKVSIFGTVAVEASSFDALLNDPTKVFSYGPTISWRPFSLLTIDQRAKTARSAADSLRFEYQSLALKAIAEVEESMARYKASRRRLATMVKAAAAGRQVLRVADGRRDAGAIDQAEHSNSERDSIVLDLEALAAAEELDYRLVDLVVALGVVQ